MEKIAAAAPFRYVLTSPVQVLAIDDDPIMREFVGVYLTTPRTTVETAASAEAGLKMLAQEPYDVVLLDIEMPGMDGVEMVRVIRADPCLADLPIVMVSGHEDVVNVDRAYEAGATSFVTKPVNWRLLSYHLRFVLRSVAKADIRNCDAATGPSVKCALSPPPTAQRKRELIFEASE
jgi:DNA-binding response OmpR family regulator